MAFNFLKALTGKRQPSAVIIVSGLPRSGTSMMMKMLEAGGLPILTDAIRTADANNPKGYYEFERVKKLPQGDTIWLAQASGKVVKVISALLEHLPTSYRYQVIFMRRDMAEVLSSQQQMLARSGKPVDDVSDEKMTELYHKHLQQITGWLAQQSHMDVLYVSYNEVLQSPAENIARVNHFVGGHLNTQAMQAVIDQALYRERAAQ